MSYPNCRNQIATNAPDIRQLAELFQNWGYDFRVILLDRSPEAIMVSALYKRNFDDTILEQCQAYLYAIKSLQLQIKALDPKFIAGAVSIERTRKENLISAAKLFGPSLNFSDKMLIKFFSDFNQTTQHECLESPLENQTLADSCRSNLYTEFYSYRLLFDKYFNM